MAWHDGRRELFNLRDDIGEPGNLAENDSELAQRMFGQLAQWRWQQIPARYDTRLNPTFEITSPGTHSLPDGGVPFTRGAAGCLSRLMGSIFR
jgi:hypothetical protein